MAAGARKATVKIASTKRREFADRLKSGPSGIGAAFRLMRPARSPPIAFAQDSNGVLRTELDGLDAAMRSAWDEVFAGNGDQASVAA
eukprot:10680304-Alexandrium_andersonii.AAC.1